MGTALYNLKGKRSLPSSTQEREKKEEDASKKRVVYLIFGPCYEKKKGKIPNFREEGRAFTGHLTPRKGGGGAKKLGHRFEDGRKEGGSFLWPG